MKSFFAVATLALSLSSFAQVSPEQVRDQNKIQGYKKIVTSLAAMNLSCSVKADCAVIPVGSRACGGPSLFVVTSKFNPKLNAVVELANYTEELESAYNAQYYVFSICSIEPAPTPKCVQNLCK